MGSAIPCKYCKNIKKETFELALNNSPILDESTMIEEQQLPIYLKIPYLYPINFRLQKGSVHSTEVSKDPPIPEAKINSSKIHNELDPKKIENNKNCQSGNQGSSKNSVISPSEVIQGKITFYKIKFSSGPAEIKLPIIEQSAIPEIILRNIEEASKISVEKKHTNTALLSPPVITQPISDGKLKVAEEPMEFKTSPSLPFDPRNFIRENKGDIYDQYEFITVLGKGAYGEVRKVKSKKNGGMFAVKVLGKNNCVVKDSLIQEIEILKNIVNVLFYHFRIIRIL